VSSNDAVERNAVRADDEIGGEFLSPLVDVMIAHVTLHSIETL
jgi:hypothetical protein